ncbi:MAG: hypothetical protein ABSF32_00630 [Ignavibacteria bacterium]|jgi:hypothetical protein
MNRLLENTYRIRQNLVLSKAYPFGLEREKEIKYVPRNTKLLAWGIFLIFFIDNSTLGLLPPQAYMLYRNVRISDFLMYTLIIYSLFHTGEFRDLLKNKVFILIELMFFYYGLQFIVSVIVYGTNLVEYFFRLKNLWASFLIFPYLLLFKRGGLTYMIKIFLPVAVISNVLYIISALTGIAFLPVTYIIKQYLPGGLEVYRVYGGTFFGEIFFIGFIYLLITKGFRFSYLILTIFFAIPQILTFGRGTWATLIFQILIILMWNLFRNRNIKTIIRQLVIISVLSSGLVYSFTSFIPESENYIEALNTRVIQGEEDYTYKEGTYGTRYISRDILIDLWLNSNILFGIGMHPFWVEQKPVTEQERLYYWGFCDLGWPAVLAAYGLVGFLLAAIFQIYFIIINYKILKRISNPDIHAFFVLALFSSLIFTSLFNFNFVMISLSVYGLGGVYSFSVAITIYMHNLIKIKDNV